MDGPEVLQVRRRLGRDRWAAPEPWGEDSWRIPSRPGAERGLVVISDGQATLEQPDVIYRHASMSFVDREPTYYELQLLHRAVWGESGWSCQVFVPISQHVNFATHALHLWGRPDGAPLLPAFGIPGLMV